MFKYYLIEQERYKRDHEVSLNKRINQMEPMINLITQCLIDTKLHDSLSSAKSKLLKIEIKKLLHN